MTKYDSHIDKPEKHTTSKGGSYITPFDLVRSKRGRELVDRHAQMPSEKETIANSGNGNGSATNKKTT